MSGGESERWIYVLLCSGGKYYVGETHDVAERFAQHLNMDPECKLPGAAWTKKYEPLEVVKKFVKKSVHDEDNTTLDYMIEHGIRNVRGGSFCMVHLPKHIRRTIKQRLATIQKLCYRCRAPGHCAQNCPLPSQPSQPSHSNHSRRSTSWIDDDSEADEPPSNHANPLFSFSARPLSSTPNSDTKTSDTKTSDTGDRAERPPLPQSEPEQLIGPFAQPAVPPVRHTFRPANPNPFYSMLLNQTNRANQVNPNGANPVNPNVAVTARCARCGRLYHDANQCFAKHHIQGHLLPRK